MRPLLALLERAGREERLLVGLMSGMSRDGVDVAVVRVSGRDEAPRAIEWVAGAVKPYESALRGRLAAAVAGDATAAAQLHAELPRVWAAAVLDVLGAANVRPQDVVAVGSHGQTLMHWPRRDGLPATTWQIGDASLLAEALGLPVVASFRAKDVAAGGEGAPLVPLADWLLFRDPACATACWNLGSIANVTLLPAGGRESRAHVRAFDTGPANALIDAFAREVPGGPGFDRDGVLSRVGRVDGSFLAAIVASRAGWLAQPPPKSAGYETWGPALARTLVESFPALLPVDRTRTAVEATARCMRAAYDQHVVSQVGPVARILLGGGGCRNPTLMQAIRAAFHDLPLAIDVLPAPWADLKEAVAFALLADEYLMGRPGNLPSATGAMRPVLLGELALPG